MSQVVETKAETQAEASQGGAGSGQPCGCMFNETVFFVQGKNLNRLLRDPLRYLCHHLRKRHSQLAHDCLSVLTASEEEGAGGKLDDSFVAQALLRA